MLLAEERGRKNKKVPFFGPITASGQRSSVELKTDEDRSIWYKERGWQGWQKKRKEKR